MARACYAAFMRPHGLLLLVLLACRSPAVVPPRSDVSAAARSASPASAHAPSSAARSVPSAALPDAALPSTAEHKDACPLPADAPTLDIPVGGRRTSPSGLSVQYQGTSHDQYDDGRFEVLAHLVFRRGNDEAQRMPSALSPPTSSQILGHCVRLLAARDTSALVQLAPMPPSPPQIRHLGDGRCEPSPRPGTPCKDGEGYCVLSWGKPGGWSSALWCRGGRWVIEEERNL